jgi:hypothetical protein
VTEEGKSGKLVVGVLLTLVLAAGLVAWYGAMQLEASNQDAQAAGEDPSAAVLSEGVLYEATAGDPGMVTAKDVGSGKELWRADLGSVTSKPVISVTEEVIEVRIAGTPWMTLDRDSGQAVE